jgi:hypothetical protein
VSTVGVEADEIARGLMEARRTYVPVARPAVVEEGVDDRTEAAHEINLFDMDQKYGDVIGVDAVSAWLRARVSDPDRSNERGLR